MSKARIWIIEALGGKCVICGESDTAVLHVDHKYGQGYLENEYFQDKEEMFRFYVSNWHAEKDYLQILCMNCNLKKRRANDETSARPKLKELEKFFLVENVDIFKLSKEQLDELEKKQEVKEKEREEFLKINPQFVPIYKRIQRLIDNSSEFIHDYEFNLFNTVDALNWLPKQYSDILEHKVKQFPGLQSDVMLRKDPKIRKVHPEDWRASALNED